MFSKMTPNAKISFETMVEKFRTGDLSPITAVLKTQLAPDAPANKWSLLNKILAYAQSGCIDWRGPKQWLKVGRRLKSGCKAVFISSPVNIKITEKNDKGEEVERVICIDFKYIPVFAIDATEGEAIASYEPAELPSLIKVAEALGVRVTYCPTSANNLGGYRPSEKSIRMGTKDTAIFYHELAHAIDDHLNGDLSMDEDKYTEQEVTAEFAAAVLASIYDGVDTSGNAWQYIKHYADNPIEAVFKAIGRIVPILEFIINFSENMEVSDLLSVN